MGYFCRGTRGTLQKSLEHDANQQLKRPGWITIHPGHNWAPGDTTLDADGPGFFFVGSFFSLRPGEGPRWMGQVGIKKPGAGWIRPGLGEGRRIWRPLPSHGALGSVKCGPVLVEGCLCLFRLFGGAADRGGQLVGLVVGLGENGVGELGGVFLGAREVDRA